jgi:S-adenosylmethionine synthetase
MSPNGKHLFTSESVTEGHPDKVADQISDAILDGVLGDDPNGRVAIETLVTRGLIVLAGEMTTHAYVNCDKIARGVVKRVGYTNPALGFDAAGLGVLQSIRSQSSDIAQGVNTGGAGDQGMMFGYACNETPERMPLPIALAHRITRRLAEVRKGGQLPYLGPDGKSQVTVEYHDHVPARVSTVVVAAQHDEQVAMEKLDKEVREQVIREVISSDYLDGETEYLINCTGRFVLGGPHADAGLTGRKIIVDTYGGVGSHGGGAFSGKDPSKVDRSGSYMARYVAKNIVEAGLADRCEVQIAYAIGRAAPVSLLVDTQGSGKIADEKICELVWDHFKLEPNEMIAHLDLRRPIYERTAAYGHFGREDHEIFTWEKTDKAEALRAAAGL